MKFCGGDEAQTGAAECVIIRQRIRITRLGNGNNQNASGRYSDLSAATLGNGSVDKLRGAQLFPWLWGWRVCFCTVHRIMRILPGSRGSSILAWGRENNYVRTVYSIMPIVLLPGAARVTRRLARNDYAACRNSTINLSSSP